jgi:hypothetical protein
MIGNCGCTVHQSGCEAADWQKSPKTIGGDFCRTMITCAVFVYLLWGKGGEGHDDQ